MATRTHYRNGDPISLTHSGCDGCQPSMINDVLCHEHGCPEAWRDHLRECRSCSGDFYPESSDHVFCNDCVTASDEADEPSGYKDADEEEEEEEEEEEDTPAAAEPRCEHHLAGYLVTRGGELWKGPVSPEETLHYARYEGVMRVPPFNPIWVLRRTNPPEDHVPNGRLRCQIEAEIHREQLLAAIRWHHQQWVSGDDKCWQDNEALYKLLPEGYTPPERDTTVELQLCEKYLKSCHRPGTEYVSPQRRIEQQQQWLVSLLVKLGGQQGDQWEDHHAIADIQLWLGCTEEEAKGLLADAVARWPGLRLVITMPEMEHRIDQVRFGRPKT